MVFDIFGPPKRKPFSMSTKKIEWMSAAGRDVMLYVRDKKFIKTSKCRHCKRKLIWEDKSYNFDHKDNNPSNNNQKNCYLVCRICHGKATKVEKRAIRGIFGGIIGHKTIKRKVSYKKPKVTKNTTTRKRSSRSS